jgi:hypothetical protein
MVTFDIVSSTILTDFCLSKGSGEEERLSSSLSEFLSGCFCVLDGTGGKPGGQWRKETSTYCTGR